MVKERKQMYTNAFKPRIVTSLRGRKFRQSATEPDALLAANHRFKGAFDTNIMLKI